MVSDRTVAVIPVHLENVAADMDPILELARARGLGVVEDTAQSMGSTYRGRTLGTIGDLGAFSLQLEKNVTAGEGGAVTTEDPTLWLRAARFQDQGGQFVTSTGAGRGGELDEPFLGENLRMTELAGAIAEVQLGRLPGLLAAMRANKRRILGELGAMAGLELPAAPRPRRRRVEQHHVVRAEHRRGPADGAGTAGRGHPVGPALRRPARLRERRGVGQAHGVEQGWAVALRRAPMPGHVRDGHVPGHRGARGPQRHRAAWARGGPSVTATDVASAVAKVAAALIGS